MSAQALKSNAKEVIACVDDKRVEDVLDGVPVTVCQTSLDCKCGTDRIAEMIGILKLDPETVIVNVQGDEPLIEPELIDNVAKLLIDKNADMATLCAKIDNVKDVFDPGCVKVVMDKDGFALYFSRCPIPYERENFGKDEVTELQYDHYHHIGIYVYKASSLQKFVSLPVGILEQRESLEQLRALENGMKIRAQIVDNIKLIDEAPADVNTPEEYQEALKWIK